MCIHRRGKQFTQAGSDSLHVVMCMHAGGKPQFTCGHVHARRQEARVYMWSGACTQAGSHSLHVVMCAQAGNHSLHVDMCVWRRVQVDDQEEGEGEDDDDSVVHHKHRSLDLQLLKTQPATVR